MCVCHPITHLTYDDHHQFDPHPTVQDFSIVLCLFLWELEQCFYKYPPIYQIMIISPTDFPQFVFPVFSHSNSEEPGQEASKPAGWSDRKSDTATSVAIPSFVGADTVIHSNRVQPGEARSSGSESFKLRASSNIFRNSLSLSW